MEITGHLHTGLKEPKSICSTGSCIIYVVNRYFFRDRRRRGQILLIEWRERDRNVENSNIDLFPKK